MKKILFAVAIVTFACTFVSCDADSIDDGLTELSTDGLDDPNGSGGPGGGGGVIVPPLPPPPPPKNPSTGG